MTETCMCWGFACGDGWFNILDQLMGNIQHHIDWKEKQRNCAIKYNEMAQAGKNGNAELFAELVAAEYADSPTISADYIRERCEDMIKNPLRDVSDPITQVTLDQVKEKFGTLRFYYSGGDDVIDGMVRMAESMSGVTCESCGTTAETNWPKGENGGIGGWVRTECKPCTAQREADREARLAEYEASKASSSN
jgi:hypothetical protein